MAKTTSTASLQIERREQIGTTGANAVRREGRIPGVLYGHGTEPVPVSVDAKALDDVMHGGHSHLIEATIAGKGDTVTLRAVQRDPISRRTVHVDFQLVSRNESISATLPIVTVGVSPGVKDAGGVLDLVTHQVDVTGPADRIPEQLEVDVTKLGLRDHVTAGDLKLPAGFTLDTPADTIIVAVESSRVAEQAEADLVQTAPAAVAPEEGETPAEPDSAAAPES